MNGRAHPHLSHYFGVLVNGHEGAVNVGTLASSIHDIGVWAWSIVDLVDTLVMKEADVWGLEVTPQSDRTTIRGTGTLKALFGGDLLPQGMASPTRLAKKVRGRFQLAA